QDAAPAEIALEQAGVAEAHAVGRADLDEIAVSLAPCLVQHPKVLPELGAGIGAADQIAHEHRLLVGRVPEQADRAQEIRIEVRIERPEVTTKRAALDQNAGRVTKDVVAQDRNEGSHRRGVISTWLERAYMAAVVLGRSVCRS